MLRSALIALLAGCIPGTGCEWYASNGTAVDPCTTAPWHEATVEKSAEGTLVVATRWGCFGFPDAEIEYRLYRVDQPWQLVDSGSVEAKHFDPRFVPATAPHAWAAHGHCDVDADTRVRCGPR